MNADLAAEIGADLAALFAEAGGDDGGESKQRLVVRSAPVHRIGSLMEEEADLGVHVTRVCSCLDVVVALTRKGQLTQAEEQRARAYLQLREKQWPKPPPIEEGARLYLDGLSVSYLQHLQLLGKIHAAGYVGVVPPGEVLQGDGFIQHEDQISRSSAVLEDIRRALADGLASGKVVLAPLSSEGRDKSDRLLRHPTLDVLGAAGLADVLVIDDRHFNRHAHVSGEFGVRPIWTTYDVLSLTMGDGVQIQEHVSKLRRAGFCLVPIKVDELVTLVARAEVTGDRLIETAELKAVRENVQLVRMSNALQLPNERVWLDNVTRAFLQAISRLLKFSPADKLRRT